MGPCFINNIPSLYSFVHVQLLCSNMFLLRFSWMHWWKLSWGRTLPQRTKFENYQNLITLPEADSLSLFLDLLVFHILCFLYSYQQSFYFYQHYRHCKIKFCILSKDVLPNNSLLSSRLNLCTLCIVTYCSRFRVPR